MPRAGSLVSLTAPLRHRHHGTQAIVRGLAPGAADDLDTVVRQVVARKLDHWACLPALNAQARLTSKLPKLTASLQSARPELTAEQVAESLQRAIARLQAVPGSYKTPSAWMDAFLGRHPDWERRLAARAADTGATSVSAYRKQVVAQMAPQRPSTTEPAAPSGTLEAAFAEHLQRSTEAWAAVARFHTEPTARSHALSDILRVGKRAYALQRGAARAAEQAREGNAPTASDLARCYQLRQQLGRAQDATWQLLCGDAFRFGRGRDPAVTPEDSARLQRMQVLLSGLTEALADVPGINAIRPHMEGAASAPKILDPARPQNVDRIVWMQEKLHTILRTLPLSVVQAGGFDKLCGVILSAAVARTAFQTQGQPDLSGEALDAAMFRNLQVGLYFAVAYPLDDLLDATGDGSSTAGRAVRQVAQAIEAALWQGSSAPALPKVPEAALVREALAGLQGLFGAEARGLLQTLALMLRGQRHDAEVMRGDGGGPRESGRNGDIASRAPDAGYLAGTVKNAATGAALAQILGDPDAPGPHAAQWALLGQLIDDLRDLGKDQRGGNVTVFTQYLRDPRGLPHPLAQLFQLVLFLDAAEGHSEGVRRFLGLHLERALQHLAQLEDGALYAKLTQSLAKDPQAPGPAILKHLESLGLAAAAASSAGPGIERQMAHWMRDAATAWSRTHRSLAAYRRDAEPVIQRLLDQPLPQLPAALPLAIGRRYAMMAPQAKHLRPLLVMMAADGLGLKLPTLEPLFRGVEKLHTASLVFDDLPAQDNAPTRRARHTLHTAEGSQQADADAQARTAVPSEAYSVPAAAAEARAQLTALALVGDVVQEVSQLARDYGDADTVAVIRYIGHAMGELSDGQMMDLLTPSRPAGVVDLGYLELLAELKTGRALEICIRSVGMLAKVSPDMLATMTRVANRLGVLYQIKDDLLDVEGDSSVTGKQAGIDARNGNQTFVTVLGLDGARARLAEVSGEIDEAMDRLAQEGMQVDLLRELQQFIVQRKQ